MRREAQYQAGVKPTQKRYLVDGKGRFEERIKHRRSEEEERTNKTLQSDPGQVLMIENVNLEFHARIEIVGRSKINRGPPFSEGGLA